MKKHILLAILLLGSAMSASAADYTYLGNGRYSCDGSGCGDFNARQGSANRYIERQEIYNRDAADRARSYQLEAELERSRSAQAQRDAEWRAAQDARTADLDNWKPDTHWQAKIRNQMRKNQRTNPQYNSKGEVLEPLAEDLQAPEAPY